MYVEDSVFLCGDALGTVKQPTGEGIYYSMRSGRILGESFSEDSEKWRETYKDSITPLLRFVTSFKKIPPKWFLVTVFNIVSKFLVNRFVPLFIRKKYQNWFVETFLDLK